MAIDQFEEVKGSQKEIPLIADISHFRKVRNDLY